MPYINLGNVKSTLAGGGTLYTHTYDVGTKIHEFTGVGTLGFCKCTASYTSGDTIRLNGNDVGVINLPHYIVNGAYIIFIAEENAMFIFNKAEYSVTPDGAIAPADDIATWCACAGLNYAELGSPSASTLATSTEYSTILFNSENAFKYYRRSSQLIKDTIVGTNAANLLDQHSSLYITPVMTSNTTPAGYSTSFYGMSGYNDSNPNYRIFGNAYTVSNANHGGESAGLILPEKIWPYKMTWIPALNTANSGGNPFIIKWQVSNDGSSWIDLDTITYQHSAGTEITAYNKAGITGIYSQHRMLIYSASGNSGSWYTGYLHFYGFK